LCFASGQANDDLDTVDAFYASRFPVKALFQPKIEVVGVFTHPLHVWMHREYCFGVLSGEIASPIR